LHDLITLAVTDAVRRIEADIFRAAFPNARIVLTPPLDGHGGGLLQHRQHHEIDQRSPQHEKLAVAAAPQQTARLAQAGPAAEDGAPELTIKASEATGALPTFRWPVRGIKAAEDGVVAYAGNEA
jgi:hypothetical protein